MFHDRLEVGFVTLSDVRNTNASCIICDMRLQFISKRYPSKLFLGFKLFLALPYSDSAGQKWRVVSLAQPARWIDFCGVYAAQGSSVRHHIRLASSGMISFYPPYYVSD